MKTEKMQGEEMVLSIVIPCLNEAKTLPIVIEKGLRSIKRLGISGEVIVADNGSDDGSVEIAQKCGARVVHCTHKGYGNALTCGFTHAYGKYLIMGDADDSYNFEEIDDFLRYLDEGYDLVMGTRLKGKIEEGAMPFLHRYLGTPVLTRVLNWLFGTRISDCNCGMRGMRKDAFIRLRMESSGMEFASEMIIKAGIMKFKIKEIPITLYRDKRDRAPHLHTWRDGWRHLKFMLLFSPTYLFILPGFFLLLLGILFMIPAFASVFGLSDEIVFFHRTLFSSMLVILGYQTIHIGIYAKAITYTRYKELRKNASFIEFFYRYYNLEKWFLIGLGFVLIGVTIDASVVIDWWQSDFGSLNRPGELAVASTFVIVGFQTVFSAFFLSILNINNKRA